METNDRLRGTHRLLSEEFTRMSESAVVVQGISENFSKSN